MATASTNTNQRNGDLYRPSKDVLSKAHIKDYETLYKRSIEEPEKFWAEIAGELEWYEKWQKVLDDSNVPFYQWFVGGKTNIVHNCIDRHLKTHRKNKVAFIWVGETGEQRTYS